MVHISSLLNLRIRRTTLITVSLIFVLLGIGLGKKFFSVSELIILPFIAATVLMIRKKKIINVPLVILISFFIGQARGISYNNQLISYQQLYKKTITVTGTVQEDASYSKYKLMSFTLGDINLSSGERLPGKVQVTALGATSFYEGDRVRVSGKLYPGYGSYQGRISYTNPEILSRGNSLVAKIRRKFSAGIANALPEPAAPFAMGILIGQRSTLPDNVKKDLLMVGLTHIIAVSGYNLTIILEASKKLLGHSKRLSTFLSLSLIAIFLLITGSSASIVRAAIVSLIGIAAGYHGRQIRPLMVILLAAVITAWANPVYVWSDIGWYLSFLAFFGVLIIAPLIKERFPLKIFDSLVGSVALESICAEIMALPYVVFMFGQMSLVGLLANVLIVGLIPVAMLLSLVSGLFGMAIPSIASIISWPTAVLLNSMLGTAQALARIPGVFVENVQLSFGAMMALYAAVLVFIIVLSSKTKSQKYVNLTDINENKLVKV